MPMPPRGRRRISKASKPVEILYPTRGIGPEAVHRATGKTGRQRFGQLTWAAPPRPQNDMMQAGYGHHLSCRQPKVVSQKSGTRREARARGWAVASRRVAPDGITSTPSRPYSAPMEPRHPRCQSEYTKAQPHL